MKSTLTVKLLPGEGWWGGETIFGMREPFGIKTNTLKYDIRRDANFNQAAPLMVSSKGRYIWSDKAFSCTLEDGIMTFEGEDETPILLAKAGSTLKEAFLAASKAHFPPSGKLPDTDLFAHPQWNTWIELTYHQNQKGILEYAHAIKENGFPTGGVIMIDDTWQYGYGIWKFEPTRFPNPKAMIDELHQMGFKVMLWVCPYVSMDSPGYRRLAMGQSDEGFKNLPIGGLVLKSKDDPADAKWWNGKSATIDFSSQMGCDWFAGELKRLQDEYGVDGFKLDAGDIDSYLPEWISEKQLTPSEHCEAYAKIGLKFPLNEYRACFKMAGQPLVQRLCDKLHNWQAIQELIPDLISAGLLGHQFVCPDMIGAGDWMAFAPGAPTPYEPEIFVRSAQIHALAPMMQFSAAPWRMLKGEELQAVRDATALRMKFTPYILTVAKASATSGEPMLRSMEYEFPGNGYEQITDQFMLGSSLLVAPQTQKGKNSRTVELPPGTWKSDDGTIYTGKSTITIPTPISRLPYFERI